MPSPRSTTPSSTPTRRERLRAQGLRRVELVVPDTRSPAFAAEARRQSEAVARSDREQGNAFVDALAAWWGEWDAPGPDQGCGDGDREK